MDSAYDHIQEESYPEDPTPQQAGDKDSSKPANADFNSEIQDAYKAISSSPWAARLGGFLGSVKKQGEQYYDGVRKEYTVASANATTGLTTGITSLIGHTRSLSVQAGEASASSSATTDKDGSTGEKQPTTPPHPDRPESLPADIVKEAEGILSRFRAEAAKRLKDIEKAEDAADEALLKFGTNISNFLRDAVTIAPPTSEAEGGDPSKVLFESKDSEGKRVIHTTRFDAQIHVIHSSLDSFLKDPVSPEWETWKKGFDVDEKTDAISKDLDKHEELRRAMEKLVPEKVEYAAFWCRYYFLRHVIESEEQRRREMLKASAPIEEEEVGWDEDSDDESPTPSKTQSAQTANLAASKETLKPSDAEHDSLKPAQPRRSNDEKSVADSDASYDLVSGATSRAPGSPQDKKKAVAEESDEEDWE
ncbi:BSD-domain-containing protein [Melanomma pulvis-pyrius CBS 109.77]|uniref:BSD-domain-containing protein n=1 Tax=Melanomma pulvis-pyrius CBS 109.77 TaxID=1314802 RepID=A0A6A6X930_9PLEO|nr:BSD-domain-containing protein [Melanomma pulvis-pyrius CBS 109.77]